MYVTYFLNFDVRYHVEMYNIFIMFMLSNEINILSLYLQFK